MLKNQHINHRCSPALITFEPLPKNRSMSTFKSINPFNNQTVAEYPVMSTQEKDTAIEDNQKAYITYATKSAKEKTALLNKLAEILESERNRAAKLMAMEMGKPVTQGIAEMEKCAWVCKYYAQRAGELLQPKNIETSAQKSYVRYASQGAVLMVMPWNFPFWQVFRVAAPAAALGNSLLLKHASNVQGCAKLIEEIFQKAGFPANYFKHLPVKSDAVEDVIKHPHVCGVSVTGSTRAGSAVASLAGKYLKKSVLELGGSNPFIVFQDADINDAVKKAVTGRFQNTGQSCIAAKRLIVHESIAEEFTRKLKSEVEKLKIDNPLDKDTFLGPMARVDLAEELENQYQKSVKAGATAEVEAQRSGAHFSPALLSGVKPGMPVFDEETFGPLACITIFTSQDEAVSLAKKSPYGLGASVFCENPADYEPLINQLPDGAVFFNDFVKSDPRLPFGGTKQSGYGRELSHEGFFEFANVQTVYIA